MLMRTLTFAGIMLALSTPSFAQQRDVAICRTAYEPAWNQVAAGEDVAAMDRVIARIPDTNCPTLRARAQAHRNAIAQRLEQERIDAENRRVAAAQRREAERQAEYQRQQTIANQADDRAWRIAQQANSVAGYNAYLNEYPYGRNAGAARRARDALNNVAVSVCNNTSAATIHVAYVSQGVGASSFSGAGWYAINQNQCRQLFTTATRTFYVRRTASDGRVWQNASTQTFNYCAKSDAFSFTWNGTCPTDIPSAAYYRYTIPATVTTFSANMVDSPQRIADEAAWATAQRANSVAGYDAYLASHANGIHAQAARTARAALLPLTVRVCNNSGGEVSVAAVYVPVGQSDNWRHVGWYRIAASACIQVLQTRNPNFYLRAESVGDGGHWSGDGTDAQTRTQCASSDAFDFNLATSQTTCPSNARGRAFRRHNVPISAGTHTWTLDP